MSQTGTAPSSGDNAHIWTGIRDIQIWVGETSQGNKLLGGSYRWPELVVILAIMGPVLVWVRHHTQSPDLLTVLGIGLGVTVILVVALRFLLPDARPDFLTRLQFVSTAAVPRRVATSVRPRPSTRPANVPDSPPVSVRRPHGPR